MGTLRGVPRSRSATQRLARPGAALGIAVLAAGLALLGACGDAPSSPVDVPADTASTVIPGAATRIEPTRVSALLRDEPLDRERTSTWVVKRSGTTIHWNELGLRIRVPANAIAERERTITITALAGRVVAYDFGPDGSTFLLPLKVTQELKGTNYYKVADGLELRGAYFRSAAQVNGHGSSAVIDGYQPTELNFTDKLVSFTITHFSGYMVSMD